MDSESREDGQQRSSLTSLKASNEDENTRESRGCAAEENSAPTSSSSSRSSKKRSRSTAQSTPSAEHSSSSNATSTTETGSSSTKTQAKTPAAAPSASTGGSGGGGSATLTLSNLHASLYAPATPQNTFLSMIPTVEQMTAWSARQIADNPPHVHLSSRNSSPQVKILDGPVHRRLTMKGAVKGGYRMSRGSHGVSPPPRTLGAATSLGTVVTGSDGGFCYFYEVVILEPPTAREIVESLPPNARLGPDLQRELETKLKIERKKEMGEMNDSSRSELDDEVTGGSSRKRGKKKKKNSRSEPLLASHVRCGWSMRTADLQAPVGYDKWSYGMRDVAASRVHNSQREDSWTGRRMSVPTSDSGADHDDEFDGSREQSFSFGVGDVMGFAINLVDPGVGPPGRHHHHHHRQSHKHHRGPKRAKTRPSSHSRHTENSANDRDYEEDEDEDEETDDDSSKERDSSSPPPNATNHIRFFKNGEPVGFDVNVIMGRLKSGGVAFSDIVSGTYYPAVSAYMGGTVRVNFGPYFIYPPAKLSRLPPDMVKSVKPVSELCPPPTSNIDEIVSTAVKEKGFPRKTDESIVSAFRDAVRTEATLRLDAYENHIRRHVEEVRRRREERKLPTADLPDPPSDEESHGDGMDDAGANVSG